MMIGRPYNEGSPYEKSRQEETPQDTSADAATRTALECQDAEMQQIRRDRETSGDIEDTENQTELQNTGANRDTVAPNRDRLTLSHFRVALNADPEAERFIISTRNGIYFIESKEANPFTSDLNRDEDIKVMSALQELIQFETTNNLLQDYRSTTTSSDPLSAARLRDILERIPVIKIIRRPVAQEEIPIESDEDTSIGLNLDDEDTPLFHTEVESFAKIEVPMERGEKTGEDHSSAEHKPKEVELHQRELTDPDEENSSALQQRDQGPVAVVEQKKDLSDSENFISKESMELKANLSPTDRTSPTTDLSSFDPTSLRDQQKGRINLGKKSVTIQVAGDDQQFLPERLVNKAEQAIATGNISAMVISQEPNSRKMEVKISRPLTEEEKAIYEENQLNKITEFSEMIEPSADTSIDVSKRLPKIKLVKALLWDCEKNFRKINSGLEIAIDDVLEDDPQRAMKIAALYEANYLPIKKNLERTLALLTENDAFQDRNHAVLLAKLAARTIEIASQSIPVENLPSVDNHESKMIKDSAYDTCLNFIDLINVLNASKPEIGNKLHECQIKIAERALHIADKKFTYAFRKNSELSRGKIEALPEAVAQAKVELKPITSYVTTCTKALFKIEESTAIEDPRDARKIAIANIINLAKTATTIADDVFRINTQSPKN
ncbi:unnamed protein product [Sphagnum compactum]